jgi:DNA-binding GntR family transcriptional regulator
VHNAHVTSPGPPTNGQAAALGATRASAVAQELRRLILSGELTAGTHLRQVELARRFNVSTTPVREALTVLARQGLVRHDAQKGVVVFSPSPDDVRENYELRIALEPLAAELAARSITDDELAAIDAMIERMRAADEPLEYVALNREFHRVVYAAARRPRLFELLESLRDAFDAYIRYDASASPDPEYFARAHAEHEAIAEALHAGAAKRARKLMETHLRLNAEHFGVSIG